MKIFLAGSVSTASEQQLKKYRVYNKVILSAFPKAKITSPDDIFAYRNSFAKKNPRFAKAQIDKAMVDYDLEEVRKSDLVVCDISEQSCGMGLELGVCKEHGKKIIFCFESGAYVSNMIWGAFGDSSFVEYKTTDELEARLAKALAAAEMRE